MSAERGPRAVCVLTGSATDALQWRGIPTEAEGGRGPFEHVVHVERFSHADERADHERLEAIWRELQDAREDMADDSSILILGLGDSDSGRHRRTVRRVLGWLIDGISSGATNEFGIDLAVNALELPPSANLRLVRERLDRFTEQPVPAVSDVVLAYEDIVDDPIRSALVAEEL